MGSFLANGNNLIAFFIGTDEGHPMILLLDDNDSQTIMQTVEYDDHHKLGCSQLESDTNKRIRFGY